MIEPFNITTLSTSGEGRIGLCRLPGRSGYLADDLKVIADWKPHLVLSLTEKPEMQELGASDLPRELVGMGIGWKHFPIKDYGIPDVSTEMLWPQLAGDLHACLNSGGAILIHCRGGLGRSGMIALRLMIERGEDREAAFARLRQARPGAVETEAQRHWAERSIRRKVEIS